MTRYFLPLVLLAACAQTPEPEPLQSTLRDGFVGQRFAWDHDSGVSGEAIHYADGTMVYDSDGRERTSRWTLSADDRYCMNAGDYDQVCFQLQATSLGFASTDGTFRYTPIGGAAVDAYGAPYLSGAPYVDAPGPDTASSPMDPVTDAPTPFDAPAYGGSTFGAASYGADTYGAPIDRPFGTSVDTAVTTGPID